jgi:DNA polymerase III epsilon subunit-like protein
VAANPDPAALEPGALTAERELVFVDCEMTGGHIERNEIIEIGAVRTRIPTLAVPGELHVKVTPRTMRGSNRDSIRIAGYNPKEWRSAVDIAVALEQLADFAQGALLVGWATHHDLLFLEAACTRCERLPIFSDAYLELQRWAQARFRLDRTPGLQMIADRLKIVRDQEHSALEDALVTYEVFRMLWRFGPDELEQVVPQLSWSSYAELAGEITLSDEEIARRLAELRPYVITDVSHDGLLARLSH